MDGIESWLASWIKWDALWYERIWSEGYSRADPRALVFPPGYAGFVGFFSNLMSIPFGLSALMINLFSFTIGLALSAELFFSLFGINPLPLYALSLITPAGFFAFIPYSDSLFLLMFWLAIWLAVRCPGKKWASITEFLLLLIAPWVRLSGYSFFSWILFKRRSSIAVLISLAGWLFLNLMIAGEPFHFLKAQQLFLMPEGNFLDGFWECFSKVLQVPYQSGSDEITSYLQFHFLPTFYFILICGASFWLFLKNQPLIAVISISTLLLSHNQAHWRSVVRYDLPLFPCVYAALFSMLKEKRFSPVLRAGIPVLVGLAHLILQIRFANLFRSGKWAF